MYNQAYTNTVAAVRSPRGVMQTCFDLHDAEACGTTKFDNLTTTATELIRKELELLVRDNYVEKLDSFRETYESVLSIENLEYEDSQMWEKILRVPQLFEFETPIGIAILKKMKPKSIEELCAASSLMRLLPKGMSELPADRYLRYRNVESFRRDAKEYGLTPEEIQVVEDVCKPDGYMTLHQETLMLMSMHPKVAGFTYKEANKLRKIVAKKDLQAQQEMKDMFYEWCEKQGTRQIFASYIWNEMFAAQLQYSFSVPHVLAYGLIALQELNLFHRFPEEYWYTALLDTEGIASEDSSGGGTDYSKITKAIYKLRESNNNIDPPLINTASNEFEPDVDNHKILFALSAIPLINDDDVKLIKELRPFKNLRDFVKRTKMTKSKVINLIKAGAFGDSIKYMKIYSKILAIEKIPNKMGITQVKKYPNALPPDLATVFNLYMSIKDESNFLGTQGNKKIYKLEEKYQRICINLKYDFEWWQESDYICITNTGLDKAFKEDLNKIKSYIKTEDYLKIYARYISEEIYEEITKGLEDQKLWEFEATSYYHNENIFTDELLNQYEFVRFNDMLEEPEYELRQGRGHTWREYQTYSMPVTVAGKNDIRRSIIALTADNKIVNVRMQDGEYAYYKKTMKDDPSWFTRGQLLILHGYRQGDEFRLKKYSSSPYEHTIYKIISMDGTQIQIKQNRNS